MIKVVSLFKKRAGLSDAEFRDYYENNHAKLFTEFLRKPGVVRYTRRYLEPIPDSITGKTRHSGFDVIMEVWCEKEWYQAFFVDQPPEAFRDLVARDEEKLFDREHMYINVVDEHDTDLSNL